MSAKTEQELSGVGASGAGSTVSQAGAGAGGAQSGVGVDQRGAQSGAGQTDVAAGYRSSGAETQSDIGQAEAYTVNLKKLVADELDHAANLRDLTLRRKGTDSSNDDSLAKLAIQSVSNAIQLAQRVSTDSLDHKVRLQHYAESEVARTVRHSDLAIDRQWNVDETNAIASVVISSISKNPVFQDAIAGAVAAAVAAAVSTGKKA